jgi:hypothetical protein
VGKYVSRKIGTKSHDQFWLQIRGNPFFNKAENGHVDSVLGHCRPGITTGDFDFKSATSVSVARI